MDKSDSLRVRDVRDAYRLIGECRDLGGEPSLWYRHMLDGLSRWLGVPQVTGGEARIAPTGGVEVLSAYGTSTAPAADALFQEYHRENGPADDPCFQALAKLPGPLATRARRQLVPDSTWFRSASYERFREPAGIDQKALSFFQVSATALSGIAFHAPLRGRDLSARELRSLEFFHAELGRLIGGALVSDTEPGPEALSRRLRETLACLLEGDSEKQVAARLGLSHATAHQYVTALYRHFGVRSRAQLMAHVMRRPPERRMPLVGRPVRTTHEPPASTRERVDRGPASSV
ncbi:MAG TPA: helix-turn-helix transcriptional regulator [Solirubrobacteraceae bacterium]|nr:helix-turn-helix transcriptional regulator [Solirubrobacteraceae bacterium]